ncbi:uncharacterized protein RSE6_02170 [Rhynchosporium secalis]|uniref:Uncharacterized protein n=1 Tax=Rhynchosporium secalis TaxID=38038 RepID=A0A1E1LZL6_RHYSE|nr:uncharacterized protein RSE6_02170 [Rhynchosporium secalis]
MAPSRGELNASKTQEPTRGHGNATVASLRMDESRRAKVQQ